MSYMLPHLHNGWQADQAIVTEEDRVVVIRFGHDWDPTCMKMDEILFSIADKVGKGGNLEIIPPPQKKTTKKKQHKKRQKNKIFGLLPLPRLQFGNGNDGLLNFILQVIECKGLFYNKKTLWLVIVLLYPGYQLR